MNQELKSKFPAWTNENGQGKYNLCLSNDADSLLGCSLISKIKGYDINHFYDFSSLWTVDMTDDRQTVGVDIALTKGNTRTWCNHVTLLQADDKPNPLSANVNNIYGINAEQGYTSKYAMSTALLICAYYGVLPSSEKAKMMLLTVDTGYKGHYSSKFRATHTEWLRVLGLEQLLNVLERHTLDEFRALEQEYQLYKHIVIGEDGRLKTELDLKAISKFMGIKLELPTLTFSKVKEFKRYVLDIDKYLQYKDASKSDREPFTLAATSKRQVCFSI